MRRSSFTTPDVPGKRVQNPLAGLDFATIEIASDAKGAPPTEFRIFPKGTYRTTKGLFLFDEDGASKVMKKASEWGNEFCVDWNHAMLGFLSVDPAEANKAAGWFRPEVRDGELWATNVTWTENAAAKLKAREYRYMSPAWRTEQGGRIVELVNVALTNLPASHNLSPLMASIQGAAEPTPPEEAPMKFLLAKLGLADTASEAEGASALDKLLAPLATLASLTGKTAPTEALAVVQAWKTDAGRTAELASKIGELEKASKAAELEQLITAGQKSGKLTEPMLAWARTQDAAALKAYLDVAQPVVPTNAPRPPAHGTASQQVSSEEIAIAKQMGISIEDLKKTKAKHAEEQA